MSTRCQIGFYSDGSTDLKKPNVLIYQHSDGYPDGQFGIVASILPFLKDFNQKRGCSDTEYCAAWALHHLIALYVKEEYCRPYLGFGISKDFHCDIEFYYAVGDNQLKVYEVINNWTIPELEPVFTLIETHSLKE